MGELADLLDQDQGALAVLVAEEERCAWDELHWRAAPLAWPVHGLGWVEGGELVGYAALAGSGGILTVPRLFASRRAHRDAVECALLAAAIRGALESPAIEGIQARLLDLGPATTDLLLSHWKGQIQMEGLLEVAWLPGREAVDAALQPWDDEALPSAVGLLKAMGGSRAPVLRHLPDPDAGLAQVLEACVHGGSCGAFEPGASFVIPGGPGEGIRGFVLATRLGEGRGHVAELAVAPACQGRGLGRALLVRALDALHGRGCATASLVTGMDNAAALALYGRLGFTLVHRFAGLRILKSA